MYQCLCLRGSAAGVGCSVRRRTGSARLGGGSSRFGGSVSDLRGACYLASGILLRRALHQPRQRFPGMIVSTILKYAAKTNTLTITTMVVDSHLLAVRPRHPLHFAADVVEIILRVLSIQFSCLHSSSPAIILRFAFHAYARISTGGIWQGRRDSNPQSRFWRPLVCR